MPEFSCAICGQAVTYEHGLPEEYPFCSARCRWVDLGKWFQGDYVIERDLTQEDIGEDGLTESDPRLP